MSSDSSSSKEKSEKDKEEDKKSEVKKDLLAVKKRKPPMVRLNSKPVLQLISSNNETVKAFKSKLEEGMKKQFDDLLQELKDDLEK